MAVVAAQDEQRLLGMCAVHLLRDALERVVKALLLVDMRLQTVVGETAFGEHLDVLRGKHDGAFDTEGAMQFAHVAVGKDIAAYHHRLQQERHILGAGDRCGIDVCGHEISFEIRQRMQPCIIAQAAYGA